MRDVDTFLSHAEIRALTGRVKKNAQIRVLQDRKIRFVTDGDGRPKVLRAAVERKLLGHAESPEQRREPDFSAFPAVG